MENRLAVENALETVTRQLGQTYPLILGGKKIRTRKFLRSINPSLFTETLGAVAEATRAQADRALTEAGRAFESWRRVSQELRAEILLRMAQALRRRKAEFIAWIILESGKNWRESDADVAEAIDFLEYYARRALSDPPRVTPVPGERNAYRYLPLGPVVVIPPWNFPLAILAGMTSAAMVTGNTVVLKPSSQTPVIAAKFMELVEEAAAPPGVVNLLTGAGRSIGDALVRDPRTRMIAFTGSKAVGLRINQRAAQTAKNQRWIKRVIAEMGGKNAIVVDNSADIAQAAEGVALSAFGYQGQKCSACSRAYVHEAVYARFAETLLEKVRGLRMGPARIFENFMGPVISREAFRSILSYVAMGRRQGRLLVGGTSDTSTGGFFIAPTIFDRLPRASALMQEEIFGPVLALAKVKSFEEGIVQANASAYGLTGAVYARDPQRLEEARRKFFCGNLYVNRQCTGALVGGHPFGGFNLSGTDSKAGGPDYLLLFQQGQAVTEKI